MYDQDWPAEPYISETIKVETLKFGKPATYSGEKRITVEVESTRQTYWSFIELRKERTSNNWYAVRKQYVYDEGCRYPRSQVARVSDSYPLREIKKKLTAAVSKARIERGAIRFATE